MSADRALLGYVAGVNPDGTTVDGEEPRTVCVSCVDEDEAEGPEVRDSDVYGDPAPYPECFECGEAMRPDRFEAYEPVRVVRVSIERLGELLTEDVDVVDGLPSDVEVESWYVDQAEGVIELLVRSDRYESVDVSSDDPIPEVSIEAESIDQDDHAELDDAFESASEVDSE